MPVGARHRVVEEAPPDVEDLDDAVGLQPGGDRQRVVAGARTDLEHALTRFGLQDLKQRATRQ